MKRSLIMILGLALLLISTAGLAQAQDPLPLPQLYQQASPSVVLIEVTRQGNGFAAGGGIGSGFVYDTQGHIITNYHVVDDAAIITISFFDGSFARAQVVGLDPDSDLAVIKIEEEDMKGLNLQPIALGDSKALLVGEEVVAIGNPFGQTWTMTTGIVSAIGRTNPSLTGFSIAQMIQTDAAINPGNSGGPLLNRRGEVVGVNAMLLNSGAEASSDGVGFAIPVNTVKRVVPELIATGNYEYTWVGINGGDVSLDIIEFLDLDRDTRGVIISRVIPNGPAAQAGLREEDIIQSINGQKLTGMSDLINYLAEFTRPGDVAQLEVLREGGTLSLSITLEERPESTQ
jgi:S1-C subfamily serine protease